MFFGYEPKHLLFSTGTLRATSTSNLYQYENSCLSNVIFNKKTALFAKCYLALNNSTLRFSPFAPPDD